MTDIQKNIFLFYIVLCLYLVAASFVEAQTYPQDLDHSYYTDVLVDAGYLWQVNSTFHPLTCLSLDSNQTQVPTKGAFRWMYSYLNDYANLTGRQHYESGDGLSVIFIPGLGITGQTGTATNYKHIAAQPFIWVDVRFHSNLYTRLYIRATNEIESLPHYSGVKRKISRAGLNTGEIDQSVIGYQSKWATVEYGRSREIWGPFAEDNLLLAGNAPAWERLMLQSNHRGFTYRWFFGFLETVASPDDDNINRYIVGRAIEYNNKHNVVISAGEVSVLAGPDRPPDWSFLNPIALHLEVEQNNRENNALFNGSNVIIFL
ncbi:hypothetical protein KA005_71275, partial [bacterium]|nr:hypothetical protein [bacterium]